MVYGKDTLQFDKTTFMKVLLIVKHTLV